MMRVDCLIILAALALSSCSGMDGEKRRPLRVAGTQSGRDCVLPIPVHISGDSVAGFPVAIHAGDLLTRCSRYAELERVNVGGADAPAVRLVTGADTIWAIQYRDDSLQREQPIELWRIRGPAIGPDSLPVPRTLAGFRERDPEAWLVADKADDSDGVLVLRCDAPGVSYMFGYEPPTPADTGSWRLSSRATADTNQLWVIEVEPDLGREPPTLCRDRPAT